MPYPTAYERQATPNFTTFEASSPSTPKSGVDLDAEFDEIVTCLTETQEQLALIQKNDGTLQNDSVGMDQITAAAQAELQYGDAISADFLVKTANSALSAERVVTDTTTVAWDWATAGQAKANVPDASISLAKMANLAQDTFIVRTTASTGVPETATCTAAGRALLDDANAAAQRTTLGLAIGTDVQAYDAELAAIAGLTSAADKGIQFTGSGTAATYDLTTAGKALLDDANAGAQRTTLGLGTIATQSAANVAITGGSVHDVTMQGPTLQDAGDDTKQAIFDLSGITTGQTKTIAIPDASGTMALTTTTQPLDAELTAIAGLTSAADKGIQFTGLGTAATYDLTTAGKALLDDADATAQRATLGLVIGTNVQAYDAELAALAGLTSAADKGIQFTGAGTAATYDLTTAGKALLDDADATAQRATLGLVIGTNVQAYDSELAAIAGLTSAADKGIQFTGAGAAATYDLTTAGKALLDDADAAAQRTTLGLGTIATQAADAVNIDGGTIDATTITVGDTGSLAAQDDKFTLFDNVNNSKQAQFNVSAISASTTRTFSLPNANTTLVGHDTSQTLTNKSIPYNSNAITEMPAELVIAVGDETTAITTGTAKVTFRMPYAMTLTAVRASLTTASSSGAPTVDINEGGTTILSTKLTIDANEKTSTTAAVAAVISDVDLADDAEITIDIDVAGTGAAGLKVLLKGTRA